MINQIIRLIRPAQWSKNLFLFLPLFFDKKIMDITLLINTIIAFISFSFVASAIYCLNDIIDKDSDIKHPEKKNRPIASGKVKISTAIIISIFCGLLGISILFFSERSIYLLGIVMSYLVLNILYSFYFKRIAIIDVFLIAIGFVMRIVSGGFAGDVHLSHWIVLMTFLLAIFLGFAKRLDDVVLFDKSGKITRKNVLNYNKSFLNSILIITSTMTIICYIMYTVSSDVIKRFNSDYVYITSVFVIIGIFRYLQITLVENKSANPTLILLKDKFIKLTILFWIVTFIIIIY